MKHRPQIARKLLPGLLERRTIRAMPPGPLIPNPKKRAIVIGVLMGGLLATATWVAQIVSDASLY